MYPGYLNSMASRAFKTTGTANSAGAFMKSFVTNSGYGTNVTNVENDITNLFINVDALRPLLRNYPLTKLCLNQYVNSIIEIIGEAPIHVSIIDRPELTNKVNDFLDGLHIKDFLAKNLEDLLYYGSYTGCIWDFTEAPDKPQDIRLLSVLDPESVVKCVTSNKTDPVRYIYAPTDQSLQTVDFVKFTNTRKVLSSKDILYFCVNPRTINSVNVNKQRSTDSIPEPDKKLSEEESRREFLRSILVNIEYINGKGVLDDVLSLLFEHMIKYIMALLLSMKSCIRPDIMQARLNPKAYDIKDAPPALQDVESLLNNGESTLDFRFSSPSSIIALIYQSILNNVKVVPAVSGYSDFDILEYPDITSKLEPLQEDLEDLRLNITNSLGIPEELIEGGSANRYEAIQRSSRFLSILKDLFADIAVSITDTAMWYITDQKLETEVSRSDIKINFNSYSILSTSDVINKSEPIYDKVRAISDIIRTSEDIKESPLIDESAFDKWLRDQLIAIDPTTEQFLRTTPRKEEEEEDSGGGHRGGGGGLPAWMR